MKPKLQTFFYKFSWEARLGFLGLIFAPFSLVSELGSNFYWGAITADVVVMISTILLVTGFFDIYQGKTVESLKDMWNNSKTTDGWSGIKKDVKKAQEEMASAFNGTASKGNMLRGVVCALLCVPWLLLLQGVINRSICMGTSDDVSCWIAGVLMVFAVAGAIFFELWIQKNYKKA